MARLDAFIERMYSEGARELRLETGAGAVLSAPRGVVPLIKQALTAQQIVGALAEVVPDDRRDDFPRPGQTVFPYVSPHGTVEVRVEVTDGKVRAIVAPYGADGFDADPGGGKTAAFALTPGQTSSFPLQPPPRANGAAAPRPAAAPRAHAQAAGGKIPAPQDPRSAVDALLDAMLAR